MKTERQKDRPILGDEENKKYGMKQKIIPYFLMYPKNQMSKNGIRKNLQNTKYTI